MMHASRNSKSDLDDVPDSVIETRRIFCKVLMDKILEQEVLYRLVLFVPFGCEIGFEIIKERWCLGE